MSRFSDVLFVCAAGNNGNTSQVYPAAFDLPNVVSVSAVDNRGDIWAHTNEYVGSVYAPGVDIYTIGTQGGAGFVTGTSMSAAFVSAIAGMYFGKYEEAEPFHIKSAMNTKSVVNAFDTLMTQASGTAPVPLEEDFPMELIDILLTSPMYSNLNTDTQELFTRYFYVEREPMLVCEAAGFNVNLSIQKALIQAETFSKLREEYMHLHGDALDEYIEFLTAGYPAYNIIGAVLVSMSLDVDISDVIEREENLTAEDLLGGADLPALAEIQSDNLRSISSVLKVRTSFLVNYMLKYEKSADFVAMILLWQMKAIGWSLNFSRVIVDSATYEERLVLPNGASYSISTGSKSGLKDYMLNDMKMEKRQYASVSEPRYILTYANGRTEYFNNDGFLVEIRNKFGNSIKFTHTGNKVTILDTLNQTTTIEIVNNVGAVTLPDGSQTKYYIETENKTLKSGRKTANINFLKRKTDALNRETKFEYTQNSMIQDMFNSSDARSYFDFFNLTKVTYPTKAYTTYVYEDWYASVGAGHVGYSRIKERYDSVDSTVCNKETYTYSTPHYTPFQPETIGGSVDLDTATWYRYTTTVTDSIDSTTTYTFNNKHQKVSVSKNGEVTAFEYNANKLPVKVTTTIGSMKLVEEYEYDAYGNVTGYYSPLAEGTTVMKIGYDSKMRPVWEEDALGFRTTITLD